MCQPKSARINIGIYLHSFLLSCLLPTLTLVSGGPSTLTANSMMLRQRQNTFFSVSSSLKLGKIIYIGSIEERAPDIRPSPVWLHMACDDWPETMTLRQLKALLKSEIYSNIALDCNVTHTNKVLASLSLHRYNASLLELPRVNIISFNDIAHQQQSELYELNTLIHIIFIIEPKFRNDNLSASCQECCIRSRVRAINTRTSASSVVTSISASCSVDRDPAFRLSPTDSLNGVHLTITVDPYFPFIMVKEVNGSYVLDGYCYEILNSLANHMNFTYTAILSIDGSYGTRNKETGEWNGMIGMVVRKQTDMVFTGLTITKERSEAVDFSYPFFEESSVVVFRLWDHKEFYFLGPLHVKVWLLSLGCLVVGVVTAWLYEVSSTKIQGKQPRCSNFESLSSIFMVIFATSLQKGEDRLMRSRAARVFWVIYWILSLVIATAYTGNLIAALAAQPVELPFSTLEGLAENTEYSITTFKGGAHQTLFEEATGGVFAKLWKKIESRNTLVEDVKRARLNMLTSFEPWAHLGDKTASEQHLFQIGSCEWRSLPETFFKSGLGVALPKGSPYTSIISKYMIAMAQTGLFDKWRKKHFLKSKCEDKEHYNSITLSHVWLLFTVMVVCFVICTIVLGLEIWMASLQKEAYQRKQKHKEFQNNVWRTFSSLAFSYTVEVSSNAESSTLRKDTGLEQL